MLSIPMANENTGIYSNIFIGSGYRTLKFGSMANRKRLGWSQIHKFATLLLSTTLLLISHASADLPPLATDDLPNPIFEGEPLQHNIESQVNIFRRTIYGFRYSIGPLNVEYDENSSSNSSNAVFRGNLLGNFDLGSYRFASGYSIRFPTVVSNWLKDGTARYALGDWRNSSDGNQFCLLGNISTIESGRFVVRATSGNPVSLHDTVDLVRYNLGSSPYTSIRRPTLATFDDGATVEFGWNDTLSDSRRFLPATLRLMRNGIELEQVTFQWISTGVPRLQSVRTQLNQSPAPYMSVDLTYTSTPRQPGQLLSTISLGGGTELGMQFLYDAIAGSKDILTEGRNLQGKSLFSYLVETAPVGPGGSLRAVYGGVRFGPNSSVPTRFSYEPTPSSGPIRVSVTYPDLPQNPLHIRLDRVRGMVLEKRFDSCPNPFFQATYHTSAELKGLLASEVLRSQCELTPVTTNYYYDTSGSLSEARHSGIDADGNPFQHVETYAFTDYMAANGVRLTRQTYERDRSGAERQMTYTPEGRISSIRNLTDNYGLTIDYDYWVPNSLVRSVTTTLPNGRVDREEYSADGLLRTVVTGFGSGQQEARSSYYYDSQRRPSATLDKYGAMREYSYLGDGRLQSVNLIAAEGTEEVQSVLSYDSGFPELVEQISTTTEKNGQSVTSFVINTIHNEVPLVQSVTRGGTNTASVTTREFEYDPATWRLTQSCPNVNGATSAAGCLTFNYVAPGSGVLTGSLQSADVAGGVGNGGFRKDFIYNQYGELEGYAHTDEIGTRTNEWTLDSYGRIVEERKNEGQGDLERTSRTRFNARGLPISSQAFIGTTPAADLTFSYDSSGQSNRPINIYDAVTGVSHSFTYNDPLRRLTGHIAQYDAMTGYELQISSNSYDLYDRPRVFGDLIDGQGIRSRRLFFNSAGELSREINSNGQSTYYTYDSFGRTTQIQTPLVDIQMEYEVLGGRSVLTSQVDNRTVDSSLKHTEITTVTLDALGRQVQEQDFQSNDVHDFSYNSRGWLDRVVSQFGSGVPNQEIRFVYDPAGRIAESFLNGQIVGRKYHSGLGSILRTDDSIGQPTHYSYDLNGQVLSVTFPDLSTWQQLSREYFDPRISGGITRRTTERDRSGSTSVREFNQHGQPVLTSSSGGVLPASTLRRNYDGVRLSSLELTSASGEQAQTDFAYDSLGRAIFEITSSTAPFGAVSTFIERSFNQIGQLVGYRYPDDLNTVVTYNRDPQGRITSVELENYEFTGEIAAYTYDGPVLTDSTLWDVSRTYGYDTNTGLLSSMRDLVGNLFLLDLNMTYDQRARLKWRKDSGFRRANRSPIEENFTYTSSNMLARYTISGGNLSKNDLRYEPRADSIIGKAQPGIDSMYRIPGRFNYDTLGNPIYDSVSRRSFTWGKSGLKSLNDPNRGVSANFMHDSRGRNVLYREHVFGRARDTQQLREHGMVLMQQETNQ